MIKSILMASPDGQPSSFGFIVFILIVLALIYFRFVAPRKNKLENISDNKKVENNSANKIVAKQQIFINYRKEDSSGYSLALYNELSKWYDKNTIFKDFHNIEPGEDFEEAIDNALNSCSILLVIISDRWCEILNKRANSISNDFVKLEIATALSKNIYIIPITLNGATMPTEIELPDDLKNLIRRQYLNIDQTRFEIDIRKLVQIIDKRLNIQRAV